MTFHEQLSIDSMAKVNSRFSQPQIEYSGHKENDPHIVDLQRRRTEDLRSKGFYPTSSTTELRLVPEETPETPETPEA